MIICTDLPASVSPCAGDAVAVVRDKKTVIDGSVARLDRMRFSRGAERLMSPPTGLSGAPHCKEQAANNEVRPATGAHLCWHIDPPALTRNSPWKRRTRAAADNF